MNRNLKLIIAYEGTRYAGFQRQNELMTIQGTMEEAVLKLTGETINLTGAGRTDAGVHAQGQVVNFQTGTLLGIEQVHKGLNHFLPDDIAVLKIEEVPESFHARYSAKSKTYCYRIHNSIIRPVFNRYYVLHYKYPLKIELMKEASQLLLGKRDFRSFQAAGSTVKNTIRTINKCVCSSCENEIKIEINADGFLYHMVRNIVGTLILIGNERMMVNEFIKILTAKDRSLAGPTVPALGLCLEKIDY